MFLLNGTPLSPDRAFTTEDGTQFPANWLRLATVEMREAIGITEEPDPIPVDQRFYWDTGIPKDLGQLVDQWISQTRTTAGTLLAPTDWYVVREIDNLTPVPTDIKDWRQAIRLGCEEKILYIGTVNTVDELAAYVTGPSYSQWPSQNAPVIEPDDTILVDGVTSGSAVTGSSIFGATGNDTLSF
jgi:hypothetical protein